MSAPPEFDLSRVSADEPAQNNDPLAELSTALRALSEGENGVAVLYCLALL